MLTFCKDKNGTDLKVEIRPDLSNPGGTKCEVYISCISGWTFSRTVFISRSDYKEATIRKSIIKYMSERTFHSPEQDHAVTLSGTDLELLSDICHNYKDSFRESVDMIRPVMEFENKLAAQTNGAYEADTTYDIR